MENINVPSYNALNSSERRIRSIQDLYEHFKKLKTSVDAELERMEEITPEEASASNKLADKNFVNDAVATVSAAYRGSYNLVSDLSLTTSATKSDIATALASAVSNPGEAETVYVQIPIADATPTKIDHEDRYKYNGTSWEYEYSPNASPIDGVFDISAYNNNTAYADLASALGTNGANIPQSVRKGGMMIRFVQSSDNKYHQFRYMGTAVTGSPNPFLNVANWQNMDTDSALNRLPFINDGGGYSLNKYFRELYITGLAAGTDYCIRGLSKESNGYIKLVIGTANGVVFQQDNIPVSDVIYVGSSSTYKIYAVFDNLDTITGSIIGGNTDVTIGGINKEFCGNLTYSPIIKAYLDSLTPAGYPFLNVNILNNKSDVYSSKAEARIGVPLALRLNGIVITYKIGTSWVLEQYVGSTYSSDDSWLNLSYSDLGGVIDSLAFTKVFGADEIVASNIYNGRVETDGSFNNTGSGKTYDIQLTKGTIIKIESRAYNGFCQFAKVIQTGVKYEPIIISDSSSLENATYFYFVQKDGTYSISSWNSANMHCYTAFSKALSSLYEAVQSDINSGGFYNIITADSDQNSDADFTGNTAIQDAIDSITDASEANRYIIQCRGQFTASLPSDYIHKPIGQSAFIWTKDYIDLDGGTAEQCVISCSLPDDVEDCQADDPNFVTSDYGLYQPIFVRSRSNVRNMTFRIKNGRYAIHIEGGSSNVMADFDNMVEGCRLIHDGKFGDSVGTTGGTAAGNGINSGQKITYKDCVIISKQDAGAYCHDNINFTSQPSIIFDSCAIYTPFSPNKGIVYSGVADNPFGILFKVERCNINPYSYLQINEEPANGDTIKSTNPYIIVDNSPLAVYNTTNMIALRVKSSGTTSSSVRFDKESTAFDAIVGNSAMAAFVPFNQYGYAEQYGYMYRDGGTGLNAEAVGIVNLREDGTHNLGKRLGDCTGIAKVLSVIIDGVQHDITFSQNYTNVTNENILAEINTALGDNGIADLYKVSLNYYPQFKDVAILEVSDSSAILAGMGVVFNDGDGTIRRAKSSDEYIDGISLDNGVTGQSVRVITSGTIAYKNMHFSIYQTENKYENQIVRGFEMGISSDNDGEFTSNTNKYTHVSLRSLAGKNLTLV